MIDPWRRLACAVLLRAVRDTRRYDPQTREDALEWLRGDMAEGLLTLLGMPPEYLERWTGYWQRVSPGLLRACPQCGRICCNVRLVRDLPGTTYLCPECITRRRLGMAVGPSEFK